uniref:Uncharacterized protein n=1 Tax=Timema monikensis TaxID=170555 RepID=A0A7R9E8M9_9NEOP|nr:unnamed protein product [Timema monikensis]
MVGNVYQLRYIDKAGREKTQPATPDTSGVFGGLRAFPTASTLRDAIEYLTFILESWFHYSPPVGMWIKASVSSCLDLQEIESWQGEKGSRKEKCNTQGCKNDK